MRTSLWTRFWEDWGPWTEGSDPGRRVATQNAAAATPPASRPATTLDGGVATPAARRRPRYLRYRRPDDPCAPPAGKPISDLGSRD